MAKISTYPFPSPPSASDYVIGTDTNDALATKNFMISDILALGGTTYVPYIGANQDVDLGSFSLYTYSLYMQGGPIYDGNGSPGSSGEILSSQGPGNSPIWVDLSTLAGAYVPYTGATGDVDLGNYLVYTYGIVLQGGTITDGNDSEGTLGQVLTSQGPGNMPLWTNIGSIIPANYYGSFYDTTDQTCPLGGIKAMKYNTTVLSNGVTIVNDGLGNPTQITFANSGVYNIQFSAQLQRTSGGTSKQVIIWLRKNGVDIPESATHITMQANANYLVAAWNFFESIIAGQYIEIMWSQDDAIDIVHEPINLTIPCPAIPSVILTVNKIS